MREAIQVIGTGSRGNCCVIWDSEGRGLMIDLGVRQDTVMKAIGYDFGAIDGAVVSHEHGDHAKHIPSFLDLGVKVYAGETVAGKYPGCETINGKTRIGGFTVYPVDAPHDVPCYSFIVDTRDNVRVMYITDTYNMRWLCRGVNYLVIECNHDPETIVDNTHDGLATMSKFMNHMSLDKCLDYIAHMDKGALKGVLLWHASSSNLNKAKAVEEVKKAAGIDNVVLAKRDTLMRIFDDNF